MLIYKEYLDFKYQSNKISFDYLDLNLQYSYNKIIHIRMNN